MKQQRKLWWLVWIALAWGLALSTPSEAAVGLEYFRAENATTQLRLTWKTGYEDSIIGFRVRRSDQPLVPLSVTYNDAPTTLIITSPENAFGATYTAYDPSAVNGQTYTYKLYEVLSDSTEAELESATVTVQITGSGSGLPTNTPTVASTTAAPTSTPVPTTTGPTSTPVPTTAGATATATTAATATASATTAASAPTATVRPAATTSSSTSGGNTSTGSGTSTGSTGDGTTTQSQSTTAAPTTTSGGVPVAEAGSLPETNQEEGYPAPSTSEGGEEERPIETTTTTTNEGEPVAPLGAEPTAYPVEGTPPAGTITDPLAEGYVPPTTGGTSDIPSIGSGSGNGQTSPNTPLPTSPNTTAEGDSSNTLLLWGGFILALFVFLTGVIGSILILRRR